MPNAIDLKMDLPPSAEEMAQRMEYLISNKEGVGVANYRRIFGPQWAAAMGTTFEDLEKKSQELPAKDFMEILVEMAEKIVPNPEQFVSQLTDAGIEWCLIDDPDNEKTKAFIKHAPERLKGSATIDLSDGSRGVEKVETALQTLGFKAVYASSFLSKIESSDRQYYPFYSLASDLEVPVFIYTTMNYSTALPMDIGHPIHIDRIAMDFPKLKIVASCGGWPWVPEIVGVARRHQNVFIDTSSHRPKYIATPGSGFEMLLQFGNTLLQDQMVFGSGVGDLGLPIGQVVKEMWDLPLKDTVKEKWLYSNAQRLFE